MQIDSRLQVAEESLANQLKGLRNSLTDNSGENATGNLSNLIEELDTIRSKLEEERKSHDRDNANLNSQLAKMEQESYCQIDQSLKLEEEKARTEATLSSLQNTLESERSAHEAEINILMRKLDNAEQSLSELKRKEHDVIQLREELEHSRDEIERYKFQTEKLQQKVATADEELATVQETPPLSPMEAIPATEDEQMALSQDEITALLKQLSNYETENKLLKLTNEEDISKLMGEHQKYTKESKEKLITQFDQEMTSLRKDYECKLKQLAKNLETSRSQQRALNDSLSHTQTQLETIHTKVHEITGREENHVQNIRTLEETNSLQELVITSLRADVERYQTEIATLRGMERTQKSSTPKLSTQKRTRRGRDEPDFAPASISPRRLSHSSDVDSHDRIIDQMKYQLEELQKIIAQRRGSEEEEDHENVLVQQLIASHIALGREMEQAKQSYSEENKRFSDQIADKNRALAQLEQKASEESSALRSTLTTADGMFRFISDLNSLSNESLSNCQERVEAASSKLVVLRKCLHDRNRQYANTLNEDMRHSREESQQVRKEMTKMKQDLEAKHEQEIRNIRNELDKRTILEKEARAKSEEMETQLAAMQRQLQEREQEVESQADKVRELELQRPVDERIEAVQHIQMQPLEGVNEALFLNTNRDSRDILTIKEQVSCVHMLCIKAIE